MRWRLAADLIVRTELDGLGPGNRKAAPCLGLRLGNVTRAKEGGNISVGPANLTATLELCRCSSIRPGVLGE